MIKYSNLERLISEFMERILNVDVNTNYRDLNFYSDAIRDIAEYLRIGRITLVYEGSQSHSNLLIHKKPLYSNGVNILFDSSKPCACDGSQIVSFSYTQSDGRYILNFIRLSKSDVWNDEILSQLRMISNISFNVLGRIKLSEISQASECYDYSTGVLNSNGIMLALSKLNDEGIMDEYLCVHMNIRHFKAINLQYSYTGGDAILKQFADYMYNYFGDLQPFGHLGEDNFIAIVKKSNKENFLQCVKNIILDYNNDTVRLKLYIGMYDIQSGDDYCAILNNSATAFNVAKNNPNCSYIMFTEKMHREALEIKQIEDVMYSALNHEEFITYYQPKVGLNDFELVGAEALVRWKKDNTLIPPFKFIPIFEKNGFITEIDFCMLRNVCRSIKSWLTQGIKPVTVSVNFSKVHLSNPRFVEQIKETIQKFCISPEYIEIEFTETLDVENYNTLVQVNRELKKYGLKTSIDDFGAGFSSLNMLKDVPVDVVKLDKSLIDDTNSSTREKIIIQDIVKMAKTLDIEVIAEGVEELDQLLFLRNINCTQIQGYIFDKPLSLEQFETRLKDSNYYKDNPKFKDLVNVKYSNVDKVSTMNFGKYTLDLNTYQVLDCNESFCEIIGYTKEEIKTFTVENFILRDEVDRYMENILSTLRFSGEVCEEHKMIKKNGTKIYVMCLGMLKSEDVAEFMVSDISLNKVVERENHVLRSHFEFAQNELKNKNYAFEQIVKNLSGGIGMFAVQGDAVRTVFASNSLYNALECKRSEFDRYKDNIMKILHPEDSDEFLTDVKSCLIEDKTVLKRYRFRKVSDLEETKTLTLNMRSAGTSYENHPLVNIVVANYDVSDIEMELINEIAKVSLLTEYSNFDMIPLKAEELNIH